MKSATNWIPQFSFVLFEVDHSLGDTRLFYSSYFSLFRNTVKRRHLPNTNNFCSGKSKRNDFWWDAFCTWVYFQRLDWIFIQFFFLSKCNQGNYLWPNIQQHQQQILPENQLSSTKKGQKEEPSWKKSEEIVLLRGSTFQYFLNPNLY